MNINTSKIKQNGTDEPGLKNRFVVFSIVLFVIILVVGSIAFILSMRHIVRVNKGVELSQILDIKQLRLESSVEEKISMVLKMANSPVIIRHFSDPDDPEMR